MDALKPSSYELTRVWQKKVVAARERYERESGTLRKTIDDSLQHGGRIGPDGTLAITKARQKESEALQLYMKALRVLADLVLAGKVPEEDS
ncbi:MAG TPA: hypothetical protein VKU19_28075 [Bryobacteraceae bacterium]|nr:hypothetical protein [Bryobacteraceae bacterium]